MERFVVGASVRLASFRGETEAPLGVRRDETFWLLIGATGVILGAEVSCGLEIHEDGRRVLVRFDRSVADLGLHCHNEVPNALYIFVDDLELVG